MKDPILGIEVQSRLEGTLLRTPVQRITKKSAFLRKKEKALAPRKTAQARCTVTPLSKVPRGR